MKVTLKTFCSIAKRKKFSCVVFFVALLSVSLLNACGRITNGLTLAVSSTPAKSPGISTVTPLASLSGSTPGLLGVDTTYDKAVVGDDGVQLSTVTPASCSVPFTSFGNSNSNGRFLGVWSWNQSNNEFVYARTPLSTVNSPTAWGGCGPALNSQYWAGQMHFFPSVSSLVAQFGKMSSIEFDMQRSVLTGSNSGGVFEECGLALGFGSTTGAGHTNASSLNSNLQIAGRSTSWDIIRFGHRLDRAGANSFNDKITADANMNKSAGGIGNDSGGTAANVGIIDTSLGLLSGNQTMTGGDCFRMRWKADFDHSAGTITFTATKITDGGGCTNSATWNSSASFVYGYKNKASVARGASLSSGGVGIALTDTTGFGFPNAQISSSTILNQNVAVGFYFNGVGGKECRFSNLTITTTP